ncbi:MAG: PTS sugar transporter subunit IIA [Candidatus Odinarchaeota archaeon]|nr:PTS sugar transporter subunit IIA [Candidatus Odinarchaeota archaeon]
MEVKLMVVSFKLALNEKLIAVKESCQNYHNAITELGNLLLKQGFVTEEFIKATLERERKYPTGLPTKIGVAIPHPPPDPKYIKKNSIAIGIYKEPVYFRRMDDPEQTVPVNIVILFALKEEEGYVKFLKNLMFLIQKSDILENIIKTKSRKEIAEILRKELKEYIL